MEKKLQVFVSSTYTDLIEERQAAVEAILDAEHIPAGMELFKAGNESQLQTIYNWIGKSDIYMLILGGRYGSIEPRSGKSYTQLEYEYAISKGIPVFSVVLSQSFLESKISLLGLPNTMEQFNHDKYNLFKSLVMTKIIREVNDCKDIQLAIHTTLNKFLLEENLTGWVRNNNENDILQLTKENNVLNKEIASLNKQIEKLQEQLTKNKSQQFGNYTFDELVAILKNKMFDFSFKPSQSALRFFTRNYSTFASLYQKTAHAYEDYKVLRFLQAYDLICESDPTIEGDITFSITKTGNLFYIMLESNNLI